MLGALAVLVIFGTYCSDSFGYIMPVGQILGLMADQFGAIQTLTVFQKTILYSPDLEGGMQELDEVLYYRYPGRFRSEVNKPELKKIQVVNMQEALTVINGKIVGDKENPFDHFKDLILYKDTDLLGEELSSLGVNLDVVSLGRFKNHIAYVIGARYPDDSVAQLWVDKDSFTPLRLVVTGRNNSESKEIQYAEYKALDDKRRYPGRVLFLENGTLVRMNVLEAFEANAPIADEMFDLTYIKTAYKPIEPALASPSKASELDRVKKSIRDFRKIFE